MKFCNMLSFIEDEQLIECARISEELGFDTVSVSDHIAIPEKIESIYPDTPDGKPFFNINSGWSFPEPWVALAMMAQATKHIRLMTSIYILPARHPVEVAKATGTLAKLSGNRLTLCAAVGWMKEEFDVYGVDFKTRGRRTDEMIQVMRKIWSGDIVEHHGEFFDFPRLRSLPAPGNVPIISSGPSDAVMRRAARYCEGWMSKMGKPEDMPPKVAKIKGMLAEEGRANDPFEIVMVVENPWGYDAVRRAEDAGVTEMILLPAFFHLQKLSTLDIKRRLWEDFSNNVIQKTKTA